MINGQRPEHVSTVEVCGTEYFRYKEAGYLTKGGIAVRQEFKLLKSISCRECGKSHPGMLKGAEELLLDDPMGAIEFDTNLVHGCIATLQFIPDAYAEYGSNVLDAWHYKLTRVSTDLETELTLKLTEVRQGKGKPEAIIN